MNEIRSWLTVKQAAFIVGRSANRIYAWINEGKVESQLDANGITQVGHMSLMRAEAATKRGRPRTTRG